ncbi:MAG: Maf family protein [Candidatus Wenzhouxiangella sp. M2_3B_020]
MGGSVTSSFVLASASPRRRELLSVLLDDFEIDPADIDERPMHEESASAHVRRLAAEKARCVASRRPGRFVLGSDTVVVLDDEALGKPGSPANAREMLAALSGRSHEVMSAVTLVEQGGDERSVLSRTTVRFEPLPAEWIDRYVASGEPMDKAGAYAVQGGAAAWISELRGSYSGVVGLPLFETATLLRRAGVL